MVSLNSLPKNPEEVKCRNTSIIQKLGLMEYLHGKPWALSVKFLRKSLLYDFGLVLDVWGEDSISMVLFWIECSQVAGAIVYWDILIICI